MQPSNSPKHNSVGTTWLDVVCTIAFYSLAVAIALFATVRFRDEGMEWLPALLLGAGAGAVSIWFLSWFFWQAVMRIMHGAPFRIGDCVEVTKGEYQGAVGKVQEILEGRYAVRVVLEDHSCTENGFIFNWRELRRRPIQ